MDNSLNRFIEAQDRCYEVALAELYNGHKETHWIWYIFPQIKGLGHSYNSQFYGISGIDVAKNYLDNSVLGPRLRECCNAVLKLKGKDIEDVLSYIDAIKLRSSMTLFDVASPNDVFSKVLETFYGGEKDKMTLSLLKGDQ